MSTNPTDTTRALMSLIVSNTATRCPNVKFIFSHAGGTLVSIAQRFLSPLVKEGWMRPLIKCREARVSQR